MAALKIIVAALFVSALVVPHAQAPSPAQPPRRATQRTTAAYPAGLVGTGVDAGVSLKVTIGAAGDVVSLDNPRWQITVFSDSPIQNHAAFWAADPGQQFVQAAEDAVRQWKFEPGAWESSTIVSVSFSGSRAVPRTMTQAGAQGPMRIGGDIRPPTKIRDVQAVYPPEAQAARVQGVVIVEATIAEDGSVADVKVLRSIPMLDQAALDAVLQWRFTPTLLNGQPVKIVMTVTVNFSLQ